MSFAVGTFDTDNQHVFGKPAFALTELACNSQRQTFFRQQRVATVARSDAPNRIVLRVMADEAPFHIEIRLGMQTAREIVGVSEMIESHLAYPGHDAHVEHDINTVRDLDPNFAKR